MDRKTKKSGKILVIDDEPSTLRMLKFLLGAYGYEVLTAESGEAGIALFQREKPDIVLTDIRMPGLDGIEVLKRLKLLNPDTEVIVFTGHGDMESAIKALQYEASDFINKPIQKEALDVALRRAHEKIAMRKQIKQYANDLEVKVREATDELTKTYKQLETIYEITQSVAEIPTMKEIIELVEEKICCATGHRCYAVLVLNGSREDIVKNYSYQHVSISKKLASLVRFLKKPEILKPEEIVSLLPSVDKSKDEEIAIVPITKEKEPMVGAAIVGVSHVDPERDLKMISLLLAQVAGAIRRAVLQEEQLEALREMAGAKWKFGDLIGRDKKMEEIYRLVMSVAESDATVLIQGESGTGKELIARQIHELYRSNGPFVVVNCAAYPFSLIESELFGHEKGAFTGAIRTRKGSFEMAHGGTIFLDEIGELPLEAQVKLLRVIQFKEFQRVGGENPIKVDVRILAATSKDLREEIEKGNFREDLYYRLNVIPLRMPPLRERVSDVLLLANDFLSKLNERSKKNVEGLDAECQRILLKYQWPGNVRELENVLEHAFILACGRKITTKDLPEYLKKATEEKGLTGESLEDIERQHPLKILKECNGNKNLAAKRLRISRSTLYRKLEKYGIPNSI
ncbi:MAG: sigma-54-dependent Fis family transcriptional regulator [Deltaproteobacteria bacterium]|nr:MAG: sigma-54-dependent Fis family transcriptional regulator [Deltaproteobacteria bacterium]